MDTPLLNEANPMISPIAPSRCTHNHNDTEKQQEDVQRRLKRAIILSLSLMMLETFGGILAQSLAIVTDAAHLLSDVSGFAVSLFAVALSQKQASTHYTYGYHQAEILGALSSVLIVWAMTGVLIWEAIDRFVTLREVDGRLMLIMAFIGLIVNVGLFGTLHHGHEHSHSHDHSHAHSSSSEISSESLLQTAGNNTERSSNLALDAAVVHIIGDMVQSIGVLIAAILIVWQPFDVGFTENGISKWYYADPACTIMFSILVMFTTFKTVSQSVRVLMQRVPESVNITNFDQKLREIDGVLCCHDVHIWSVGSSNVIATAHVVVSECEDCSDILIKCKAIALQMGIGHSTFQLEVDGKYNHADETFGDLHARDEQCCGGNKSSGRSSSNSSDGDV
jgi:zinc transporter 2